MVIISKDGSDVIITHKTHLKPLKPHVDNSLSGDAVFECCKLLINFLLNRNMAFEGTRPLGQLPTVPSMRR